MIENLSQLKKAINNKQQFRVVRQYVKPQFEGEIREITKTQSNAFYSKAINNPNSETLNYNGGLGSILWYGNSKNWKFENGLCKYSDIHGDKVYPLIEIEFIGE